MHILILCKVVDNYGDIGFVYRLSRSLSEKYPEHNLSLVVSNLKSFSSMAREIEIVPHQKFNHWDVLDWNDDFVCKNFFKENPPKLILECFQCGRPDWLDELLSDKNRTDLIQILNVEYLTAEDWAEDFHMLKSGTRFDLVKKTNFMPGFTNKTGGLVLDKDFMEDLASEKKAKEKILSYLTSIGINNQEPSINQIISRLEEKKQNRLFATVFAYNKNMEPLFLALKRFQEQQKKITPDFNLTIFAASGLSFNSFEQSWIKHGKPFELIPLPYLNQLSWDALLTICDFNFIRGEDSFSRACLSGKPFLWNAYVQDEEFQLVKVKAVVDLMKKFFLSENKTNEFQDFLNAMMIYNKTENQNPCDEALEALEDCNQNLSEEESIYKFLISSQNAKKIFQSFSQSLIQNGDLSEKLEVFFGK